MNRKETERLFAGYIAGNITTDDAVIRRGH